MSYFKPMAIAAIATTMLLGACSKNEQASTSTNTSTPAGDTITLRFNYFWPATSSISKEVFEPWAKAIEEESGGRLKVELYPSATIAKPDITYDSATKGTIDIGSQVQGYTAGRFPISQIAELPGLSNSASQMSCLVQSMYDEGLTASEYEDSHVLFMYGAGPSGLHSNKKAIRTAEDIKGMRIRRPSAIAGDLIEGMGGSPVGMPATEVYTSLQRGVMDALTLPWESIRTFRIDEVTKYHTNIPFYSSALVVNMNKAKYESLPDDLKKVLDDNSGMKWAMKVGEVFDKHDKAVLDAAKQAGHEIIDVPDPLNDPAWADAFNAGIQKYLDGVAVSGVNAQDLYEKTKVISQKCKPAT